MKTVRPSRVPPEGSIHFNMGGGGDNLTATITEKTRRVKLNLIKLMGLFPPFLGDENSLSSSHCQQKVSCQYHYYPYCIASDIGD
jgi:hypothetical protein